MANIAGSGIAPWGGPGGWELARGATPVVDPTNRPEVNSWAPGGSNYNKYMATVSKPAGGSGGTSEAKKKKAANNQYAISRFNADSAKKQYEAARANFDLSDRLNREKTDKQMKQNSRTGANDRFNQLRRLQASTQGILGSAGNALQGSQAPRMVDMLRGRNDLDNSEYFGTLTTNQNATIDSFNDAATANAMASNDALATAVNMIRASEGDLSAQLNNIDPKYFTAPGTGRSNLGSSNFSRGRTSTPSLRERAGYFTQAPTTQTSAPSGGNSYFDKLISGYSGR